MPSIATLEDILEALGTNLSEFFHEEPENQIVFSTQDFFVDEQEDYSIEWVIPNAQKNKMEPILLTLHPHKRSQEMESHHGEEFGYVLKGTVTLVRGSKKYRLKAHETFYLMARAVIICTTAQQRCQDPLDHDTADVLTREYDTRKEKK